MRVDSICKASFQPLSEQRSKISSSSFLRSSIQIHEHGTVRKVSILNALLEDLLGFFRNLFFFPFLGHQILFYQILLGMFMPVLLPYIIFTELIYLFLNLFTCGCLERIITPQFDLTTPTESERIILSDWVAAYGNQNQNKRHQIRLAHIMSRYVDYVARYSNNEDYGSKYARFQSLIKIEIDETSKLFQFCPWDDKESILREYLEFVGTHLTPKSKIKHHFLGLDYQYVLGLLNMELKTDIVDYNCQTEVEKTFGICGKLFSFFAPTIGKHVKKDPEKFEHFALWPKFSRNAICSAINRKLASKDLESSQISLLDLEHLIRG